MGVEPPADLLPRPGRRPPITAVVGPGRAGKTAVLDALATAWEAGGVPVLRLAGRRLEQDQDGAALDALVSSTGGPSAELTRAVLEHLGAAPWLLLVDAGQWLDGLSLRAVAGVAERAGELGGGVVVAHRPCPERSDVAALDAVLGDHRAALMLPTAADAPSPERLRLELDQLSPPARRAAVLLALGLDPAGAAVHIDELHAAGLAEAGGKLAEAVAAVVLELTTAAERVAAHDDAAQALIAAGAPAWRIAPHLEAAGTVGRQSADLLVAAARAEVETDPQRCLRWLDAAVAAGADPGTVAGDRAWAAALAGDVIAAALWADHAPDSAKAAAATAAVLAAAGLPDRWADRAAALAGDERLPPAERAMRAGEAALAALVAGRRADAGTRLAQAAEALGPQPTLRAEAVYRMARGALAASGDDPAAGLEELETAAALVDQMGGGPLLGDTPHALAAIVALQLLEVDRARRIVERGRQHRAGGPLHATRLLLLACLTDLCGGRLAEARAALAAADAATPADRVQTRDRVVATAMAAGLARRGTDAGELATTSAAALEALAATGPDYLAVTVAGEVAAAAARRPGGPTSTDRLDHAAGPLQAFHARWWRLQTCVAAGDGAGVEAEATALASVDLPHPRLAVLVEAATRWAAVLDGSAGASDVITTAGSLAALGFAWEGATLAGAAALRTTDPEDARALLACGRELRVADQPDEQTDAGPLSEREREVAALVVEGLTHKEIGARLFVSAKTVEHHVAKIRQKLGVTSRAELLAALRGEDSQP